MTAGAPLLHGSGAVIRSILALLALYAATAAAIGRKPVRPMEARVEQMERLLEQSQQRASQAEAVIQQMQEAMQQQAARAAAQDAAAEAARAIGASVPNGIAEPPTAQIVDTRMLGKPRNFDGKATGWMGLQVLADSLCRCSKP